MVSSLLLVLLAAAAEPSAATPPAAPDAPIAAPAAQTAAPAEPVAVAHPPEPLSGSTRALYTALAVVPGLFYPGFGHQLSGDPETAHTLRWAGGLGALGAVGGLALLWGTGGSYKTAPVAIPVLFTGATAFLHSWLSDVVGTAAPNGLSSPLAREEQVSLSLQYGYSSDPITPVKHLGLMRAAWENSWLLLDGWGSLAPGTRYRELHGRAGPKLWSDGHLSHLSLMIEGMGSSGAVSQASAIGGSACLELRYALGRIHHSLNGLVLLQRLGGGSLRYSYRDTAATDWQALLVLDSGMSVAVRDTVELSLLYTQRPDTRLGWIVDHGGAFRADIRVALFERMRALATIDLGGGFDALLGLEAAW